MKHIKDQEEKLFAEWKADHKGEEFINDGLLYSEHFYENGQWKRRSCCEEQNWCNALIRPLFLLKDLNGNRDGAFDIRTASCFDTNPMKPKEGDKFGRNLIRFNYGIIQCCKTGVFPTFEEAKVNGVELFKNTALVRMNIKKTIGSSNCSSSILKKYIEQYSKYIIKQINIYDANIIYSGGISMKPDKYLRIIPNWESYSLIDTGDSNKDNLWILYSEKLNKIIINGYHLSHRHNEKNCYNDIMTNLQHFLERYPKFRERLYNK